MVVNAAVPRSTPKSRRLTGLFWLLLALLAFGCGFHRDDAAAERLRARIQAEVGSAASVNVRTAYGATTVTIRLERLPAGDSKLLQERVEALTKVEFPRAEYVVLLGKQ
jgi:predicted component of type VI protein secretion system